MDTIDPQAAGRGAGGPPRSLETLLLRGVGVLDTLLGVLMLAAWVIREPSLKGRLPSAWMVSPQTAFGLVLIGAAVLLQTFRTSRESAKAKVAIVLSAVSGALAALTLIEHSLGIEMWTYQLLGGHANEVRPAHAGRMGVNSAVCLMLSAMAVPALRHTGHTTPSHVALAWIGASNTAISVAALGAHIEAARAGYNWLNLISMSMPAALLYTIEGLVFIWVAARRAAFRWAIGRVLTFQFANGLALLYAVAAVAYLSALRVGEATQEMRRSGQVQEKIWALRGAVDQLDPTVQDPAEATGRTSRRLPDTSGELTAKPALELYAELTRFVEGNPQQAASAGRLREPLDGWVDFQYEVQGLLETQGIEAARRLMLAPKALQRRADLYRLLFSVAASESQRALQSESRLYTELERTFGMLPLVAIVGTLVLGYGVIRLSIEMTTRESIAKALTLAEARQRLAVEAAGIGDWELNPSTHVITCSARYYQILGFSASAPDWTYEKFMEHVHPEDRDRVDGLYRQSIKEAGEWKTECRVRRQDGTTGWIWLRGRCFKNDAGLVETVRGVLGDVTERRVAEEEIRSLNASLEQRVRERTEKLELAIKELDAFTYSVSHDLRAPLRAIDGFSKLVIEDHSAQLPQEARRKLVVISAEAGRMSRLIDDLLAFSRLGRAQVHPEQIDMQALAKAVFQELLELGANTRKIDCTVHPMPAAMGTEAMVRQVWTNLISNALKFTRGREICRIEIGFHTDAQGESAYYIKDNGVGFDMRHAGKLFGVFQRLHSDKEFEGTGAGLALVQRIVHRHGGKVWAEAEQDKGATFFFTLPTPNV